MFYLVLLYELIVRRREKNGQKAALVTKPDG
jgi:hypothetical protein